MLQPITVSGKFRRKDVNLWVDPAEPLTLPIGQGYTRASVVYGSATFDFELVNGGEPGMKPVGSSTKPWWALAPTASKANRFLMHLDVTYYN